MVREHQVIAGNFALLVDEQAQWDLFEIVGIGKTRPLARQEAQTTVFLQGTGLLRRTPEPTTLYKNKNVGIGDQYRYFGLLSDVKKIMSFEETEYVIEQMRDAETKVNAAREQMNDALDRFNVFVRLLGD